MESWGFLLLCSHLGNPERKPLTTAQLRVLSQRVQNHGPWEEPGDLTPENLKGLGYPREFSQRIVSLLAEEALLSRYLQKAKARKCVPITRQDPRYPKVLREKLGPDAPGTLWAKGDLSLLDGPKVSLVGSRELEAPNGRFAEEAGLQAARQGYVLVSGNAIGADRTAQRACWKAGGKVICVVADALHSYLESPNVLYLSEEDYDMPFSPFRALRRNRVIHALGQGVLVAQSHLEQGGSWKGTKENLKHRWTPVFGYQDGSEAMAALQGLGAELIGLEALADLGALLKREQNLLECGTFPIC